MRDEPTSAEAPREYRVRWLVLPTNELHVVAAALEAEYATLYTEDVPSGQVIDGRLAILDPFQMQRDPA